MVEALTRSLDGDSTGRQRRRLVRSVLDRRVPDLPLSVHELAREVAVALVGSEYEYRAFDHVLWRLHYRDIPQLVETSAISYDRTAMTVDVDADRSSDGRERRPDEAVTGRHADDVSLYGWPNRSRLW